MRRTSIENRLGSKTPEYRRARHFRKKYGLNEESLVKMKEDQQYCCAICGDEYKEKNGLHVDHCHTTGQVRGLLCRRCNMGVGQFRDSTGILYSAVHYLQSHKKKNTTILSKEELIYNVCSVA